MGSIAEKRCWRCGITKPLALMSKDRSRKGGYKDCCLECTNERVREWYRKNRPKACATNKARRERNPEQIKAQKKIERVRRYGITLSDYERMFVDQNGMCAICGKPFELTSKGPHIDHCHVTGRVRGLLCNRCNFGLGSFLDNPYIMMRAIEYLSK